MLTQASIQEQYSLILRHMSVRALNALMGLNCPDQHQVEPPLTVQFRDSSEELFPFLSLG